MDYFTNIPTCDGCSTLLVIVDCFSKMMYLVPHGEKTEAADIAATFFQPVVQIHDLPSTIISDNDLYFQSEIQKFLMKNHLETSPKFSIKFHQTDGQSERSIHSILQMLGGFVHKHPTTQTYHLTYLESYYNAMQQQHTARSPHEIVFGW